MTDLKYHSRPEPESRLSEIREGRVKGEPAKLDECPERAQHG
jgi:hypothetical protein